jgi:cholesterol oxidase
MQGVRAAVCSQVTTHPKMTLFHRLKTKIRTGTVLQGLGVRTIQPDLTPNLPDKLLDLILRIVPTKREEHCNSAVCRWIFAFYGPTHRHAQLNQATHEDLGRLFGVADIDALNHISRIVRKGRAVDAEGHDAYLPHAQQLALPILFLAGAHNRIFLPETSARTLEWLSAANGPQWYRRIVLDDYAHLDGFIGRDAAAQVYPVMADYLKAHAGSRPPSTRSAG